ncbi:MAG: DNA repair protein RadA [Spirochaetia bacterium]|nr:DNA repair protein RadA [Spirochaetia bacterium]
MKTKIVYKCADCGEEFPKWMGQCMSCHRWNSLEEVQISQKQKTTPKLNHNISSKPLLKERNSANQKKLSGLNEFDKLLGGGFTPGSVILLGGEPGVGKSTLLLTLARTLSNILYVSGEESFDQIKDRAVRVEVPFENVKILQENDLETIVECLNKEKPEIVFIDSIQTVHMPGNKGFTGSVSQIRETAQIFLEFAKKNNTIFLITGHITKEGQIAGPKLLEHAVDVVLYFENQNNGSHRFIRSVKNRFGAVGEIAVFSMSEKGLHEVSAENSLLPIHEIGGIGSVLFPQVEGSRIIPLEVQVLVTPTGFANGRRIGENIDISRIHLIAAILEKFAGYKLSQCDIFVRTRGGTALKDNAGDLALLLAMASSYKDIPLLSNRAIAGEVSLTGKIRTPSHLEQRQKALQSLNIKKALWGGSKPEKDSSSVENSFFSNVSELLKTEFK